MGLQPTSTNQLTEMMLVMFYSCLSCNSVCVFVVQSARSKLHVVPKFIRSMSDSAACCELVRLSKCVAGCLGLIELESVTRVHPDLAGEVTNLVWPRST